jgi:dynein light intermediate chain, axonemal
MPVMKKSLINYKNPILVNTSKGESSSPKKHAQETKTNKSEDILNSILPPRYGTNSHFSFFHINTHIHILYREWTHNGKLWVQYVSSTPATRGEVIDLQDRLDQQLQVQQARETGICPVREELYAQCFGMSFILSLSLSFDAPQHTHEHTHTHI